MGLLTDILKEIPQAAVLKEKIANIEAKYAAADTENAILKDDLREAKGLIAELKQQVKELSHIDDLNDVEINLLHEIADKGVDNSAISIMAPWFNGSEARLAYHFNRLSTAGYIVLVYGDDSGGHFAATQKGLELLVEKNLI